jgi:hypothetical protein
MIESTIYHIEKKLSNPSCCGLFDVCVFFFSNALTLALFTHFDLSLFEGMECSTQSHCRSCSF